VTLSMDHPTSAQYERYIAPRLRSGETVLFCARWSGARFLFLAILGLLFFGLGTLYLYVGYYTFDSVDAACSDSLSHDCRETYAEVRWVVPIGAALTAFVSFTVIATVLGWHKQLYTVTNQRAITCRIGFPRGFDVFELRHLTYRKGLFSLKIRNGWRRSFFFLDRPARDAAEACLAAAIEGSQK
jgi:hypothetical protein